MRKESEREGKTRVHIQIKGNQDALKRMEKVVDELERIGVEVQLTTERSRK